MDLNIKIHLVSDTVQILFQKGIVQNMEKGLICINLWLTHQSPNQKKGNEGFFIVKTSEHVSTIFFICCGGGIRGGP